MELVHDGAITMREASKQADISEEVFRKLATR